MYIKSIASVLVLVFCMPSIIIGQSNLYQYGNVHYPRTEQYQRNIQNVQNTQTENVQNTQNQQNDNKAQNAQNQQRVSFSNVVDNLDQFSANLLWQTLADTGEKNVIMSPYSVWVLLTVLSEGAAGDTYIELINTLKHIDDRNYMRLSYRYIEQILNMTGNDVFLESFNNVFHVENLKFYNDFVNTIKSNYKVEFSGGNLNDPKTVSLINQMIERQTRGKITNLFKPEDLEAASMVLSNTIFFKGKWTFPFEKKYTSEESFYDDNNRKIGKVNMMFVNAPFSIRSSTELDSDIIELPYGEMYCKDFPEHSNCAGKQIVAAQKPRFSMIVILPNRGVALDQILRKLSTTLSFRKILEIMDNDPLKNAETFDLFLPRFQMNSEITLKNILKNMGISRSFDASRANFTKIASNAHLWLSKIQQKAVIDVNEEGTEASAATAAVLVDRIAPAKIKINRPFIYAIVEKLTNTIIFMGVYSKPLSY